MGGLGLLVSKGEWLRIGPTWGFAPLMRSRDLTELVGGIFDIRGWRLYIAFEPRRGSRYLAPGVKYSVPEDQTHTGEGARIHRAVIRFDWRREVKAAPKDRSE